MTHRHLAPTAIGVLARDAAGPRCAVKEEV